MSNTISGLKKDGYCLVKFNKTANINELRDLVIKNFSVSPTEWHKQDISMDAHVNKVKALTDLITESELHVRLIQDNLEGFQSVLGPDIDVQATPHLRVSRPQLESDLVDWHRDTFYGNTVWEMNLWLPLFELEDEAGLRLLRGSHLMPSKNVREIQDTDPYRSEVKKGSAANQIGYVYLAKTDDTIQKMKPEDSVLLRPKVGEGIFFFGCMVHRAQNLSNKTRISLDLRLKPYRTLTETKAGYYKPLSRGVIETTAQKFLLQSE